MTARRQGLATSSVHECPRWCPLRKCHLPRYLLRFHVFWHHPPALAWSFLFHPCEHFDRECSNFGAKDQCATKVLFGPRVVPTANIIDFLLQRLRCRPCPLCPSSFAVQFCDVNTHDACSPFRSSIPAKADERQSGRSVVQNPHRTHRALALDRSRTSTEPRGTPPSIPCAVYPWPRCLQASTVADPIDVRTRAATPLASPRHPPPSRTTNESAQSPKSVDHLRASWCDSCLRVYVPPGNRNSKLENRKCSTPSRRQPLPLRHRRHLAPTRNLHARRPHRQRPRHPLPLFAVIIEYGTTHQKHVNQNSEYSTP